MLDLSRPIKLSSKEFHANKYQWYEQIREQRPVHQAKVSILTVYTLARYEDCTALLKDPRVFENPGAFNIERTANHHLGFGHGVHYCLGAHLARAETRIALRNLIERIPDFHLAIDHHALELQRLPGWHRYAGLPIATGRRRTRAAA